MVTEVPIHLFHPPTLVMCYLCWYGSSTSTAAGAASAAEGGGWWSDRDDGVKLSE